MVAEAPARQVGLPRRLALRLLRYGILPAIGAAPALALGAIVGAVMIMVALGWIGPDGVFIWGLGVVAVYAVAAVGFLIALVLVWFRPTRPLALGYVAGAICAVLVDVLIFVLVPVVAHWFG